MSHAVENDGTGTGKLLLKLTRASVGIFYHTANAATIAAHALSAAICRHGSPDSGPKLSSIRQRRAARNVCNCAAGGTAFIFTGWFVTAFAFYAATGTAFVIAL